MKIESADQITEVSADGIVSYTKPEETVTVSLEELRHEAEAAAAAQRQAEETLAAAIARATKAQEIYEAVLVMHPKP